MKQPPTTRSSCVSAHWVAALVACCVWLAPAAAARAFSDYQRFLESSGTGGGGGRFFTGSPVDGYSCAVCHRGGPEPNVKITGLPLAGYRPGGNYNIEISWDNTRGWHGVQLEFVGRDAMAGGSVEQLAEAELGTAGRCGTQATGDLADYMVARNGRQIVGLTGCGASSLRFRFTAPNTPDVSFSASVVLINRDRLAEGDGVQDIKHVLRRAGEPAPNVNGNCSLAPARPGAARSGSLVLLLVLGWLARRRRFLLARAGSRAG